MIRPNSEIEYPPSDFLRMKASMIARMEQLNVATHTLMSVISERVGAQNAADSSRVEQLTAEQELLISNMRKLASG